MARMAAIPLQREPEIEYPDSDGKPMAETELHLEVMVYLRDALKDHFSGAPDVYIAGNMLFYYEEGQPKSVIAPDVFVVRGIPRIRRRNYLLWKEGQAPCLVVEVTSSTTRRTDTDMKKALYEKLGIPEYFMFDPMGDYLKPPLQGFRLFGGEYRPLPTAADGSLTSRTTGVVFRPEGESVRLIDAATGQPLLSYEEWRQKAREAEKRAAKAEERASKAEERATQEATARREAEARARELEEEIERLRRKLGA